MRSQQEDVSAGQESVNRQNTIVVAIIFIVSSLLLLLSVQRPPTLSVSVAHANDTSSLLAVPNPVGHEYVTVLQSTDSNWIETTSAGVDPLSEAVLPRKNMSTVALAAWVAKTNSAQRIHNADKFVLVRQLNSCALTCTRILPHQTSLSSLSWRTSAPAISAFY
jgi:hypothetical protein